MIQVDNMKYKYYILGINENMNSTANKGVEIDNDREDDDKDEEEKQLTEGLLSEPDYSFFMFINEQSGSKRAMDLIMLNVRNKIEREEEEIRYIRAVK